MSSLRRKNRKKQKGLDENFKKAIRELPCILCGAPPPSTVSHIKTRGSGGKDEWFNLKPLCLSCHRFWEENKFQVLCKYPHAAEYLKALGWEWEYKDKKLLMWRVIDLKADTRS